MAETGTSTGAPLTTGTVKSGYVNGSDMLLYVGDKAIGHCTSHTTTFDTETKDRAVKPEASKGLSSGLWKSTGVTGLSVSISFEGLAFYNETEFGPKELLGAWKTGKPVKVKCMERGATTPYLSGLFVITQVEEEAPANDDTTYKGTLKNAGEPDTIDETQITETAA